jgi:hypothetical protein
MSGKGCGDEPLVGNCTVPDRQMGRDQPLNGKPTKASRPRSRDQPLSGKPAESGRPLGRDQPLSGKPAEASRAAARSLEALFLGAVPAGADEAVHRHHGLFARG